MVHLMLVLHFRFGCKTPDYKLKSRSCLRYIRSHPERSSGSLDDLDEIVFMIPQEYVPDRGVNVGQH